MLLSPCINAQEFSYQRAGKCKIMNVELGPKIASKDIFKVSHIKQLWNFVVELHTN